MEVLDLVVEAPDRPSKGRHPFTPGSTLSPRPEQQERREVGEAGALALRRRPPLERARAEAQCRHRVGARPCQGCRARRGRAEPPRRGPSSLWACHAAAGTSATGPALAKREGEGGLEERRARERSVCCESEAKYIFGVE